MTTAIPEVPATDPGGGMERRIAEMDWSKTPVGPIERWPQSLKIAVQILLTSRYAMWMGWGPEFTFFCNDAYLPTVGVKRDWVLGASARKVWAEIWPDIGPRAESVVRTGKATWDEALLLFLERSGFREETYHTFSYSPVPDDHGGIGGMLCVVTEETDRIISERRLGLLGELASDLAATQEEHAVFAAIERRIGQRPHDLPFALVYLFDDRGGARLACAHGLALGGEGAPLEVLPGAESIWPAPRILAGPLELTVDDLPSRLKSLPTAPWDRPPRQALLVPIARQGQERPAGFLVAGINPYRPLDTPYRRFLSLLAGQIAAGVSNARAYEEERRRAQALTELDRAKTAFFSNISHEFRTPLTLMIGPLEDMVRRDGFLPPALRNEIDVVRRNGVRLLKLVNTLLDFARLEAGRVDASYEPTDIGALTAELASSFRSAIERAGMRLEVQADPVGEPVYLDRDMWEKVILNLLSNAFKHTFSGEIAVCVRRVGRSVQVSVRDTGVGIPPGSLPRLFDRFYRIQGSRSRTHEGSGIGLALVHELVHLHGGTIEVTSEVDRGSEFTVSIPLGSAHLPQDKIGRDRAQASGSVRAQAFVEEAMRWIPDQERAPERAIDAGSYSSPATEPVMCPGARIVLADDNADMRGYISRLLLPHYRVEEVADGSQALRAAQGERPDLVLSDVMMPGLDGFQLLEALRADAVTRSVPVILVSARAGEESRVEGMAAGANDYLIKPFSARELLARVGAQLALSRVREEALERERTLRKEAETLNVLARDLSAELDLRTVLQKVTDAGTQLTGAQFGAFFYNAINEQGELYQLYTLSGAPREAFDKFGAPRNTPVFSPTFRGESVVRVADITEDPRYGRNAPHRGMPDGHLPVRAYLAVPVKSRSGEVIGGLFFGHPDPGVFTEQAERIALGVAAHATIAIDNARLYEQLGRQHSALEEAVRERTDELRESHQRLRLSERLASLGTLSAGLGHDMGNLLLPVRVCVESLEHADLSPELLVEVKQIKTSAEYLQQLANGLRLMAIDPDRTIAEQQTDLGAWWNDAYPLMRTALPRGISIEADFRADCPVGISKAALTQVIFNLVQNAGEAMRSRGRGTVRVRGARAGDAAILEVEDDGPGMSPEVRDRCMEPFFTTKTRGISTGLGLVLVSGLVREAGGAVELRSEVGRGSCFTLRFPIGNRVPLSEASAAPGSLALVDLPDRRLSAFVSTVLSSMQFQIVHAPNPGNQFDLAVVRDPAAAADLRGRSRRVLLLGASKESFPGLTALDADAKPSAIRDALRSAANELLKPEAGR